MGDQGMLIHLVAGGLAGTFGAILTSPLDVVKTRLQASSSIYNNNETSRLFNKFEILSQRLKENSLSTTTKTPCQHATNTYRAGKLFKTPHLSHQHHVITSSLRFELSNCHQNQNQNHGFASKPKHLEIKMRSSIYHNFKEIARNEGYRAFFKGLGPNIVGVAPYRAIYFFSYANSKLFLSQKLFENDTASLHMLSAFIAGFTATTITNPIWFVKTRLQLDETRRGKTILEVIESILKEKGILGFYKGISASYFGIAESALYFVLYEKLKYMSSQNSENSNGNLTIFSYLSSASFAKTLASVICYPHEVARTRLREEGNKYQRFFQTLGLIVKEEGFGGMYKGMGTHLIRQIPNTAIVMTTYEMIIRYFR